MSTAAWIVAFSLLGSLGSTLLAGAMLLLPEARRRALTPLLISYATGTLLGGAFLGLLPHALESAPPSSVFPVVLAGILGFFILEKLILWRHCHHEQGLEPHATAGPLLMIGDTIHNALDGVIIATSFMASGPLGIMAGIGIMAHEIPQELGDFSVLLESGWTRRRALAVNALSSLATPLSAAAATFFLSGASRALPPLAALAASSFLYVGMADLIPVLHRERLGRPALRQTMMVLLGVATAALLHHDL